MCATPVPTVRQAGETPMQDVACRNSPAFSLTPHARATLRHDSVRAFSGCFNFHCATVPSSAQHVDTLPPISAHSATVGFHLQSPPPAEAGTKKGIDINA